MFDLDLCVTLQDELWSNAVYVKEANAIAVELNKKVGNNTGLRCMSTAAQFTAAVDNYEHWV